jgi:hypothetical protein
MESKEINIHKFSKMDIYEIIKNHLIDIHGSNFQSGTVEVEWGAFLPEYFGHNKAVNPSIIDDTILTFTITEEK